MTTLRAAEKFDKSHLSSPSVAPLIEGAKAFYVEGFFLTHGSESALELSKTASNAGKVRALSRLSLSLPPNTNIPTPCSLTNKLRFSL